MMTKDTLRKLVAYDPESGLFTSLVKRWTIEVGSPIGTRRPDGYYVTGIGGRSYLLHRLAWVYVHGDCPPYLDHINRDPSDNRLCNLRPATISQNGANTGRRRDNRAGLKGVTFIPEKRKWRARVQVGGKRRYLGYYDTPEAAHEAYISAAQKAFGAFARAA